MRAGQSQCASALLLRFEFRRVAFEVGGVVFVGSSHELCLRRVAQSKRVALQLNSVQWQPRSLEFPRSALAALPLSRFVHFVRFTLETLISIVRNALILSCGPGSVLFGPRSHRHHRHLARAFRAFTYITCTNLVVFHRPAELIFASKLS